MSKIEKLFNGKFTEDKEITFKATAKEAYLMFERNQGLGKCDLKIKGLSEYVSFAGGEEFRVNSGLAPLSLIKGCEYKLTLTRDYPAAQKNTHAEAFISICYVEDK
jgi:hypothetical protein